MKAKDLRLLENAELNDKLDKIEKQMYELNSQRASSKVEKPHLFKSLRKDAARILTILRERGNGKAN